MTIKDFLNDYNFIVSNIHHDIKVNNNLVDYSYLVSIQNLEIKEIQCTIKYNQLESWDIEIFNNHTGMNTILDEDIYTIIVPSGAITPRLEINIIV